MGFFDRLARASMSPARLMMCDSAAGVYRRVSASDDVLHGTVCPNCGSRLGTLHRKGSGWSCGLCFDRVGC